VIELLYLHRRLIRLPFVYVPAQNPPSPSTSEAQGPVSSARSNTPSTELQPALHQPAVALPSHHDQCRVSDGSIRTMSESSVRASSFDSFDCQNVGFFLFCSNY